MMIRDCAGRIIAKRHRLGSKENEQYMKYLVHTANTHLALLEALEKAHAFLEPGGPSGFGTTSMESVRFAEKARELRNELQSALATARA